jgi:hypothetical protein
MGFFVVCAGGGNRTRMIRRSLDFESSASTNFTTPASIGLYIRNLMKLSAKVKTQFAEAEIALILIS